MFSQACVTHSVQPNASWDNTSPPTTPPSPRTIPPPMDNTSLPPGQHLPPWTTPPSTPPGQHLPPPELSAGGRYASYWNAFLLKVFAGGNEKHLWKNNCCNRKNMNAFQWDAYRPPVDRLSSGEYLQEVHISGGDASIWVEAQMDAPPPSVGRMTDACENIIFPILRLRAVKIEPYW